MRGGIVIVRPPEVTILLGEEDIGGFLVVEEGAFFTGMALGTVSTFPSDFFKLSVVPPFILTTSVSELKLSISSLPSSKGSPFLNHTPLFLALSKIEKYHSPLNLKKPLSSTFVFWGFGGGGGGVGLCTTGGLGFCEPGLIKGFCPLRKDSVTYKYEKSIKKILR